MDNVSIPMTPGLPTCLLKQKKRSLLSNVHTEPITLSTLASYRRLITLLLPIRYPDRFYKDSVANITDSSLARVAIWHERETRTSSHISEISHLDESLATSEKKVAGGIQCRLEDIPSTPAGGRQLYIQTVGVLAPYRQLGIATYLLEDIISTIIDHYENVTSVYAHVWEANTDALEWYSQRGFSIEKEVLEGYYRRLKPSGARIVRRGINIEDHVAARERHIKSAMAPQEDDANATIVSDI
ncbi:MAG: hypothetical protein Q9195_002668 [Heterodermia aff. obscurata]